MVIVEPAYDAANGMEAPSESLTLTSMAERIFTGFKAELSARRICSLKVIVG